MSSIDEVVAGEILPAKEAIAMLDQVDLGPTIDIPEIPPEADPEYTSAPERERLKNEILRLKTERNAIILSHNYVQSDIQDVSDAVGDSLFLAREGAKSDADVLCEPSVLFMNQILAAMKKPHQTVLAPDLGAVCSLAAHADAGRIREWKQEHTGGLVISYVNTYLDVKAESDYCCASANAAKVLEHVLENSEPEQPILFLPDVFLGFFAAKYIEKHGHSLDRLWLMLGACHVHEAIRPHHVNEQMRLHPEAAVVIHPECGCTSACMTQVNLGQVPEDLLQFRSTQGMVKLVQEVPQQEIIMATEVGNLYPMSKAAPEKTLIPASAEAKCSFMKQNTLQNLHTSLRDMVHEVTVDPELAERAKVPIERMISIG
ncbi:MAG: quinolinate synthase NadA [Nitrospinaceae bacterium]|jgi:quinolinate synthase|nr:quinolinate synthase NadA [Nitrospinaceae bacterium]MBT5367248.1 quinolinate synthase NadA [Nitrospinaceae bacterium]